MKKLLSFLLILALACLFLPTASFSDDSPVAGEELSLFASQFFDGSPDSDVQAMYALALAEMLNRGMYPTENITASYTILFNGPKAYVISYLASSQIQSDSSDRVLKPGTYSVGTDIAAGTYRVTCTEISDEHFNEIKNAVSEFYYDEGYDLILGSLDSFVLDLADMQVNLYDANGRIKNSVTLQEGDTDTITVEPGMKISVENGSVSITEKN